MLSNIEKELLSTDYADISENYIAIALYINEHGIGQHSGLLISIDGELKLFHFDSKKVQIEDMDSVDDGSWYYSKKIDLIHSEEVLTFLSHCELIEESASPKWALIFDGSYYNKDNGLYFTQSGMKEYTTCVGFCINVISGFLNGDIYFNLDSWDENSTESFRIQYAQYYDKMLESIENENPTLKDIYKKKYLKRITPSEYTISAFTNNLPIEKTDLDPYFPEMTNYIYNQR